MDTGDGLGRRLDRLVRSGARQSDRTVQRSGTKESENAAMVPTDQSTAIDAMRTRNINHKQWDQYNGSE